MTAQGGLLIKQPKQKQNTWAIMAEKMADRQQEEFRTPYLATKLQTIKSKCTYMFQLIWYTFVSLYETN